MDVLSSLRFNIHQHLLERYDLGRLQRLTPERQLSEVRHWVEHFLLEQRQPLNTGEQQQLIEDVQHEMLGLGPLEPLLKDTEISDILVNGPHQIYVERHGRLNLEGRQFADNAHLIRTIERIVSRVGRRIDESSPMVDARLPDGSRVNAIIPPLALDGPVLSIRRFATRPFTLSQWVMQEGLNEAMACLLQEYVRARLNILVSGGTGTGKTTLLNVLSGFVDGSERLVTIEDTAELRLSQPHVIRLETRPANVEGQGEISTRQLVRNALRMRPDRLIVGEVRGAEALDMLQAMNTGHEGAMSTLHANSPEDALVRLEQMAGQGNRQLTERNIRAQIASAIQIIIQTGRLPDGQRKIMAITELQGNARGRLKTLVRWRYRVTGGTQAARYAGCFEPVEEQSLFQEKIQLHTPAVLENTP